MANQNFRVKKGLEVGAAATFLYADDTGVGINSVVPRGNLDVRGDAYITQARVGPSSVVGLGTTSLYVDGDAFFDGNVEITGDILFEDAVLDDLRVTGIVSFNVGIGTTLTVEDLNVTNDINVNGAGVATIGGDPVFNTLTVLSISTFGGANTTGMSTFYHDLQVQGDLQVGGDIQLIDLDAGNISVGGSVITDGLVFNVGIGTTLTIRDELVVSGVSSLSVITGVGSELQYLPAGSISTTVGVGSTTPPSLRPTGEPVQEGDLWFDQKSLRQFTFTDGVWVDSNPPPIQPKFRFDGDIGLGGELDIADDIFDVVGTPNQILTRTNLGIVGVNTLTLSLTDDVNIINNLTVGNNGIFTGSVAIGNTLFVQNDVVIGGGITFKGDITIEIDTEVLGNINQNPAGITTLGTLDFGAGTGDSLTLDSLVVDSTATLRGAGIVTVGSAGSFTSLDASGITTLGNPSSIIGFVTTRSDLYVGGDLKVAGDIDLENASTENINVSGIATFSRIEFGVGIGSTLTIANNVGIGSTLFVGGSVTLNKDLTVKGDLRAELDSVFVGNVDIDQTLDVTGNITGDDITGRTLKANETLTYGVGTGQTLTVQQQLNVNGPSGLGTVTTTGTVTVGTNIVIDGENYKITLGDASISGTKPGIGLTPAVPSAIRAGDASFETLEVRSSSGISTINGDVRVLGRLDIDEDITARDANFSGISTFVGVATFRSDVIIEDNLTVGEQTTLKDLTVNGTANINGSDVIVEGGNGVFENISASGIASIGYDNPTGVSTFFHQVDIRDDLIVTGLTSTRDLTVGFGTVGILTFTGGAGVALTVTNLTATGTVSLPGIPVSGGIATFQSIAVSGLSTFSGISTFGNDVNIKGNLVVSGSQIFEQGAQAQDFNVLGITTTTDLRVTGFGTFDQDLFVQRDLFVNRNALFGDPDGITGLPTSGISTFYNIDVEGVLTATGSGSLVIEGPTTIDGVVTIGTNTIVLDGTSNEEFVRVGSATSGALISGFSSTTGMPSFVQAYDGTFEQINVTGIITARDINSTSDKRVKENIRPIENALDKVIRLNGVHFNFVNSGKPSAGVIAQDVEQVFPDLIAGTYPKSVNYNGLIGALIESVKELKAQNDDLLRRIEKLEG